jgi:hypothetical protein
MASQPQPPAPPQHRQSHAQEPSPEQKTGPAPEPREPQKYDRPLPQPGDKDYVVGQPIDDAEADKVEKEQHERFVAAQKDKSHEKD